MDGWWDCQALDEMCCRAIRARLDQRFAICLPNLWALLTARLFNQQTRRRSRKVARVHYDLSNDFFEAMLDPNMQYSCALFEQSDDLATAQLRKLRWICERLRLRPGLRLLDIGCGWGGLACYAARHYGCHVVGITISREQLHYAQRWSSGLGVQIQLQDYREVSGRFDRVASVGMIEHVGYKNYRTYFRTVADLLTDDGLFLCQGIAGNSLRLQLDPWIKRYIFPNSVLPCAGPAGPGLRRLVRARRYQEHWTELRPHTARMGGKLPAVLVSLCRPIWRTFSQNVAILSAQLRGRIPGPQPSGLFHVVFQRRAPPAASRVDQRSRRTYPDGDAVTTQVAPVTIRDLVIARPRP